jgi:hypothetical protein
MATLACCIHVVNTQSRKPLFILNALESKAYMIARPPRLEFPGGVYRVVVLRVELVEPSGRASSKGANRLGEDLSTIV